ncbi:MFS transporter [Conexibacter sp. DBS9H8]|uniref:MFS transporter n=1 Tax=Conexibacter sp. DBS9H8 TaxID=2937801 RepID=UPI00200E7A95|nr:MFS transporter [Conexibacter sp. DBS9H8]
MAEQAAVEDLFRPLDEAEISQKHWLTVLTAGMGFFTDAYDLFIIGTVTVLLTPIFHLSTNQISLLNSISLLASVFGALIFGRLMDRLGRKRVYGLEIALLSLGAVLSALSWNFTSLLIFRIIVGIGVGGDYATSSVITAEYANRRSRGRLVGTVFAMQAFGLIAGPAIASVFLGAGVSTHVAWRVMLGLGAIPALSVVYLRRKIKETPRFRLVVEGDVAGAAEAVSWTLGDGAQPSTNGHRQAHGAARSSLPNVRARLTSRPFLLRLIGTAGSWFLLDIAFYGNSVSSPLILKQLEPHGTLLAHTLTSLAIFVVAAFPGYWMAVWLMDRIGRKRIQWQGFTMMAIAFGAIGLIPGAATDTAPFLILFGISYFFTEFGPNVTTFVYPSEVFPTSVRGLGEGISAGSGKFGAFLGALIVPHLLKSIGISGVMEIMAVVSLVGIGLTLVALPEPMGKTLEESSEETIVLPLSGTTPVPAASVA